MAFNGGPIHAIEDTRSVPYSPEDDPTPEQRDHARRVVCSHAKDVPDARQLLAYLGLD